MRLNALAALGHRGIKTIRTFGRAGLMLFNALVGKAMAATRGQANPALVNATLKRKLGG